MGLRDKIKEAIEEFDWIKDIDSKVEEESINILYNKPFYWYSPLEKSKWVSFHGMPKIYWLEEGIDSAEVNVCTHKHTRKDFYAKDCSPFFRSTVVNKFDRGVFVLQPQLTDINESKNDFDWVEDVLPEEYKFFTVYVDDGIAGGSYFIKVPNLKFLEYDLDDCCPIDVPVTKEEAEDFLDWATSEKEIEDRDYEYIEHVRQIGREEYCRAFGNYRDEDRNDMNICGGNKETISELMTEETPSTKLTKDELKDIAKKFKTRGEWKRKSQSTYIRALNIDKEIPGFFDDITSHMEVLRRSLSDDKLRDIAKKYETRTEWYRKNPNTYRQALRRGQEFFDSATSHMRRLKVSEKYIYAYEFYDGKEPIAAYIGLTCDMRRRSKEHETGFCQYGKKESTVTKYIKNNPTLQYKIVELETEPLEGEEAKKKEAEWEEIYRKNGWKTLNVVKTGALGIPYLRTNDELRDIAKKYKTRNEWKHSIDGDAYRQSHSRGKEFFDDITSHMVSGKARDIYGRYKSKN